MVWTYPESSWNCLNHKNIYGLIAVILKHNSSSSSERAHKYYANFPSISFFFFNSSSFILLLLLFSGRKAVLRRIRTTRMNLRMWRRTQKKNYNNNKFLWFQYINFRFVFPLPLWKWEENKFSLFIFWNKKMCIACAGKKYWFGLLADCKE